MSYDIEAVKAIPIIDVFRRLGYDVGDGTGSTNVLCPFHDDKDPSLRLYPDTNTYNCFSGCRGSTTIDAVMASDQVSLVKDAIKWLGDGFNLTEQPPGTRPTLFDGDTERLKAHNAESVSGDGPDLDAGKVPESGFGSEPGFRDPKSRDMERAFTLASPYGLREFILDMQNDPEGLAYNFPGIDGEKLDEVLRLEPGTVNIIAGRPGHGKTTFMLNAMANMIAAYPSKAFMYVTYEEIKKGLAFRFVRVIAAEKAPGDNPSSNIDFAGMRELLKGFDASSYDSVAKGIGGECPQGCPPNVWDALNEFYKLTAACDDKGARAFLLDAHCYVGDTVLDLTELEQLFRIIAHHCENESMRRIGCIFIDYAQKIPPPSREKSQARAASRQQELADVNNKLVQLAKHNRIPVVIGAQFNREVTKLEDVTNDRLREAGDFEQDASTVLGLWHGTLADHERADGDGKIWSKDGGNKRVPKDAPEPRGGCELNVKVLKNRNGRNPNLEFTFNVSTGYITGYRCSGDNRDRDDGIGSGDI